MFHDENSNSHKPKSKKKVYIESSDSIKKSSLKLKDNATDNNESNFDIRKSSSTAQENSKSENDFLRPSSASNNIQMDELIKKSSRKNSAKKSSIAIDTDEIISNAIQTMHIQQNKSFNSGDDVKSTRLSVAQSSSKVLPSSGELEVPSRNRSRRNSHFRLSESSDADHVLTSEHDKRNSSLKKSEFPLAINSPAAVTKERSDTGFFSKMKKSFGITDNSDKDRFRKSIKTWDSLREHYKIGDTIGKGTQGEVMHGTKKSNSMHVIIKVLEHGGLKSWNFYDKMPITAYILRCINSVDIESEDPLFTKYVDHFLIGKKWVIITKYEDENWIELFDFIRELKKPLLEPECMEIFSKIVKSLFHLYQLGFTHNDIKESNILINRNSREIKLIDLCSSREITTEMVSPGEFSGTAVYASPEIRSCNLFSPAAQDIYSLGILLLYMIFKGKIPGADLLDEAIDLHQIPKILREKEYSVKIAKLIISMLQKKASKRITIEDLMCEMGEYTSAN